MISGGDSTRYQARKRCQPSEAKVAAGGITGAGAAKEPEIAADLGGGGVGTGVGEGAGVEGGVGVGMS